MKEIATNIDIGSTGSYSSIAGYGDGGFITVYIDKTSGDIMYNTISATGTLGTAK